MLADIPTQTQVMEVMGQFADAYKSRDEAKALALFASDPDVAFIGSRVDEKRIGISEIKIQLKRDWAQTESASFEITDAAVSAVGAIAWVMADIEGNVKVAGKKTTFLGRLTAVLERRGEKWLLMHLHLSLPFREQDDGEMYPD